MSTPQPANCSPGTIYSAGPQSFKISCSPTRQLESTYLPRKGGNNQQTYQVRHACLQFILSSTLPIGIPLRVIARNTAELHATVLELRRVVRNFCGISQICTEFTVNSTCVRNPNLFLDRNSCNKLQSSLIYQYNKDDFRF